MSAAFHAFVLERGLPSYDNEIHGGNLGFSFPDLEQTVKLSDDQNYSKNHNIRHIAEFNELLIDTFAIGTDTIDSNNCMFMSLAWWLYGTTRSGSSVRSKVCTFLELMHDDPTKYPELAEQIKATMAVYDELNWDQKSDFTENFQDVYPEKTCNNSHVRGNTWILKAAAQCYQVCIVVVQETSIRHPETKKHYKGTNQETKKPRWLKYEISHIIKPEKIEFPNIYQRLVWLYYDGINHWNYLFYKTNPIETREALDSFLAIPTLPEALKEFKISLNHGSDSMLNDIKPGMIRFLTALKQVWGRLRALGLSEEEFLKEFQEHPALYIVFTSLGFLDDFFQAPVSTLTKEESAED